MLVNSISLGRDLYVNRPRQNTSMTSVSYSKNVNTVDTVAFTGLKPEIVKNQFKILLSQDIWAYRLAVKMPESEVEKEALLELLEHRVQLERFTRLQHEKGEIIIKLAHAEQLAKTNPQSPELQEVLRWLDNKGNLDATLNTLNKQMEQERKRNKPAFEYFEKLRQLEDEYLEKRLVKGQQLEKFWHKIKKGNINVGGQYSTRELIEIIKTGKLPNAVVEATPTVQKITSKKDVFSVMRTEYRRLLRENVNVYATSNNHTPAAKNAQSKLLEMYATELKRFGIDSGRLDEIFKYVEREFNTQIDNIMDVDIYPLGEHWNQMSSVENKLRALRRDINLLNSRLKSSPDDAKLQAELAEKMSELDLAKKLWITGMRKSVDYEAVNRDMMIDAGKLKQYEYLTGENKILKMHKEALKVCEENDGVLPEEMWGKILSL